MALAVVMSALGHKPDMCSAKGHVRFTPKSGRDSGHRGSRWKAEHSCSACTSNVDLLRDGEGIVHIDAEIPHSALYLSVINCVTIGSNIIDPN
jgi:hypothetical protein